jgi:hypothetical protein
VSSWRGVGPPLRHVLDLHVGLALSREPERDVPLPVRELHVDVAAFSTLLSASQAAERFRPEHVDEFFGEARLQHCFCRRGRTWPTTLLGARSQYGIGQLQNVCLARAVLSYDHRELLAEDQVCLAKHGEVLDAERLDHA